MKSVYAHNESDWLKVWFDPAGRITMKVSQQGEGPTVIDDDLVYDDVLNGSDPTWLPGRRVRRSIQYYTDENEE